MSPKTKSSASGIGKRKKRLIAYTISDRTRMNIVPAPSKRRWMDQTPDRFANRCLPMLIANGSGWLIENPSDFIATWTGGRREDSVKLLWPNSEPDARIMSHFGDGILTFTIPYLFRTPPGINLWVKGPSNLFKDGATPLEGIVETDWSDAPFTMNWKLTRRNTKIRFVKGEPISMIVPVKRGFLEEFQPDLLDASSCPHIFSTYSAWRSARSNFNRNLLSACPGDGAPTWQRDYFQGKTSTGEVQRDHQSRVQLREFKCT